MEHRNRDELLSAIIPCLNEEAVLRETWEALKTALARVPCRTEVIFVDDGSSDGTLNLLKEFSNEDASVRIISLSRNFGQQTAYSAGLRYAKGDMAFLLDADLQDSPEYLESFVAKRSEGYEVVYGTRKHRPENAFFRGAYHIFYRVLSWISDVRLPHDAGDFSLIDRKVIDVLNATDERNRYVRGLRTWAGFRQVGIPCEREQRAGGVPKYNLVRLAKLAFDGILSFSYLPLHMFAYLGFLVSAASFALLLLYLTIALTVGLEGRGFATLICVILFLGGVQLMGIGVLGLYLGRIYDEVKHRPLFVVNELVGFDAPEHPGNGAAIQFTTTP